MYRTLPYLLLFAATALLQLFLFDNLSISVYLNPLVYIAVVLLLPLDASPAVVLGTGLAAGVMMDGAMGAAGLNTIATLPVAFLRPTLIGLVYDRDDVHEGGVPSPERLGKRSFAFYVAIAVVLHHVLFFSFETLSWDHAPHTLVRIAVSSLVAAAFVWLVMRIFTSKLPGRV